MSNEMPIYAVMGGNEFDGMSTYGIFTSEELAREAADKFQELDYYEYYDIERLEVNKLNARGEYRLEDLEEQARENKERKERESSEEYLDAHPWMKRPWTDVAEIRVKEGELVMDFATPTNARIYKEFAGVWAKSVERLAERLGISKYKANHYASLHGFAFWAMSTECKARDIGYDVAKFLKDAHCSWSTRTLVEEDAMSRMRIAHTVHIADEMYEQSLQIRKWAESYGLQPSELLV